MTESKKEQTRVRRTNAAIEKAVLNAVEELIQEIGFKNITLTGVAERAKIEPAVFYRRYASLDELFDKYTRKYDFWLGDLALQMPKDLSQRESFKWILLGLIRELYKNKVMQQLLVWELSDNNETTRRTSKLREKLNKPLVQLMEQQFSGSGIDINVISSMMIAGIYYLILHRKISTFCDVDYNTRIGKDRFNKGIEMVADIVFDKLEMYQEQLSIAQKLRDEGVSEKIISKVLPSSHKE